MHFDFTISLGTLITIGSVLAVLLRVETLVSRFMLEHEILIREYCKRNNITIDDLPTRGRWRGDK